MPTDGLVGLRRRPSVDSPVHRQDGIKHYATGIIAENMQIRARGAGTVIGFAQWAAKVPGSSV